MNGGPDERHGKEARLERLNTQEPSSPQGLSEPWHPWEPAEASTERGKAVPDAEWMAFEDELTRALRPVELPAGFADRVLARAAVTEPRRAKVLAFPRWRVALSGAVAAALVAGSLLGVDVHQSRERARAQAAATAQFEAASRITDEAMEHTRQQLERAGVFSQQR